MVAVVLWVLQVLMDAGARQAYNAKLETALADEDDDYTGEPLSKWMPGINPAMSKNEDPNEDRAVFVVSSWVPWVSWLFCMLSGSCCVSLALQQC